MLLNCLFDYNAGKKMIKSTCDMCRTKGRRCRLAGQIYGRRQEGG